MFKSNLRGSMNVEQLVSEAEESVFQAKVRRTPNRRERTDENVQVAFASGGKASKYFNDAFYKVRLARFIAAREIRTQILSGVERRTRRRAQGSRQGEPYVRVLGEYGTSGISMRDQVTS